MMKIILFFTGLALFFFSASSEKEWGKIRVGKDKEGHWEAFLENEKVKVRYGYGMGTDAPESCIREVILKNHPDENLAGPLIDASAHRGVLTTAKIIRDTREEKTIYLEWETVPAMKKVFAGPARCEISIFSNSPVLKIRYLDFCFAHTCDIGLDKTHVLDKNWGGVTRVYGFQKDSLPQYEDCFYCRKSGIFGCDTTRMKYGIMGEPDQLSYKGQMIMGVYNKTNNLGFGRVLPASHIQCIKILWNKGFEIFPQGKNYTGYLYFFDQGEKDVLHMGKEIANKILP